MSHPQTRAGFTLVEIMIVVAIIGLLASLAIPNFITARENAQRSVCIENLVKIEEAKTIFSADHKRSSGDSVDESELFGPDLYIRKKPACPAGGEYLINSIGSNPECTFGPSLGHEL